MRFKFYNLFTICLSLIILCQCNDGKVEVLWIPVHELSDSQTTFLEKICSIAFSMIDWAFLPPIQLPQPAIFFHKCDEMGVDAWLNGRLAFLTCFFVLGFNFFAFLKYLSPFFCLFAFNFLLELCQVGILLYNVGILFKGVDDYVEQGNCAACIMGKLLHEEHFLWNIFWVQTLFLVFLEIHLNGSLFKKEHDTKNRLR